MKKIRLLIFLLVLVSFVFPHGLFAQAGTYFDMSGFPQWARDLRRGEIVAFGAFPLAYIFANFGYDSYRFANNNWDSRFAPWPFNSAESFGKSQDERFITLGLAAGLSVFIAVVDYAIVRARRSRLARESRSLQEERPVIIRRSMFEEEDASELELSDNGTAAGAQ